MENARDTLGGNCAVAESAFPTAPWTPPQAAPTGTTGILLDAHLLDSTSRISTRRCNPDGRQLTDQRRYAPMSVHLRRNLRSRSPESVFTFAEIATTTGQGQEPPPASHQLKFNSVRDIPLMSANEGSHTPIPAVPGTQTCGKSLRHKPEWCRIPGDHSLRNLRTGPIPTIELNQPRPLLPLNGTQFARQQFTELTVMSCHYKLSTITNATKKVN